MKDNFSKQSDAYAVYRPRYSAELVSYILSHTSGRQLVWDCATGNGQMAVLLAPHVEQVFATDLSSAQIANATPYPNIEYQVEVAEHSSLASQSVDLVTVAQAIHWFKFDAFYAEVKRVLRPGGTIALVGYPLSTVDDARVNDMVLYFYKDYTGAYWDPERKYIDDHYTNMPFPFREITDKPDFALHNQWSLDELTGYLSTWSAVQHFKRSRGFDPVPWFREQLQAVWPARDKVGVRTDLLLKIGIHEG
jgi:ubiquinone/menaquinone biosynthesis C-methylase UbiE